MMLQEDASTLDRMEKTLAETTGTLNKTDAKLTSLTNSVNSISANVTSHNGTHLKDWQAMQEDRLKDIVHDVDTLQAEGYILDEIHEHTMIMANSVVFVVLITLGISLICIKKKFGFLTEQLGNALRSITP